MSTLAVDGKTVLLASLLVLASYFVFAAWRVCRRQRVDARPSLRGVAIGVVTDFLDTLGIGSFATTTTLFRATRLVHDEQLPGTLNLGHTLPTVAQALIYVTIVEVDFGTLFLMIAAAVAGSWLGASRVAGWPKRTIQLGMAWSLLSAAVLMILSQTGHVPAGGTARALGGPLLALGLLGNFALGALMALGIGLYGPCLMLVSLLGMDPLAAFPIMMGSCAFLMPVASLRFLRAGRADASAAAGLTLGGVPAVLAAAFLVRSLPLTAVRVLVIAVVLYASASLFAAVRTGPAPAAAAEA